MAANPKSVVRNLSKAEEIRQESAKIETIKVVAPSKKAPKAPKHDTTSVVGQVLFALLPENRIPTAIGFLLYGGPIPIGTFYISHFELLQALAAGKRWLFAALLGIVLAGLVFSAITVYEFCQKAYDNRAKSIAWTALAELMMMFTGNIYLAGFFLGVLVFTNGTSVGVNLAIQRQKRLESGAI